MGIQGPQVKTRFRLTHFFGLTSTSIQAILCEKHTIAQTAPQAQQLLYVQPAVTIGTLHLSQTVYTCLGIS